MPESLVVSGDEVPVRIYPRNPEIIGKTSGTAGKFKSFSHEVKREGRSGYDTPQSSEDELGGKNPVRPMPRFFSTPLYQPREENEPRIDELKKLFAPLIKGHELEWATITESLTSKVDHKNAGMMLQALTQQLNNHPEALRHATSLLYQASTNKLNDNLLQQFFKWLRTKYRLTPRQKRADFTRILRGMRCNWYNNPADQIGEIIARAHLTWEQIADDSALCEELKAAVGSKIEPSLFLQLSGTPVRQW